MKTAQTRNKEKDCRLVMGTTDKKNVSLVVDEQSIGCRLESTHKLIWATAFPWVDSVARIRLGWLVGGFNSKKLTNNFKYHRWNILQISLYDIRQVKQVLSCPSFQVRPTRWRQRLCATVRRWSALPRCRTSWPSNLGTSSTTSATSRTAMTLWLATLSVYLRWAYVCFYYWRWLWLYLGALGRASCIVLSQLHAIILARF